MSRHPLPRAALCLAALLLAPAAGTAQYNNPVTGEYYSPGFYTPGSYSFYSPTTGMYYRPQFRNFYSPPITLQVPYGFGPYYAPGFVYGPARSNLRFETPRYYAALRDDAAPARSPAQADNTALLTVRVPVADAEVWVEGRKTKQQGTRREFVSPPLNPDRSYAYQVRARWEENGQTVEQQKTVRVRANGRAEVDFRKE